MANTPSSGQISMNDVRTAFPAINSGSMNAYRGQTYYIPNTGNTGTFPSGQISLTNFYNTTGTQQIPIIPYQNILVTQWAYHMGGCYGTGVNNLYVQIGSYYGITATATGWAADYTVASPGYEGNWSPSGWTPGGSVITNSTLATVSQFINTSTGFPYSNYTGAGQNTYADGRDTNAIRVVTAWDGTNFTLTIQYDCKGGGNGWGTTLYSAIVPVVWTPGPY
jgi:hypothetical protein